MTQKSRFKPWELGCRNVDTAIPSLNGSFTKGWFNVLVLVLSPSFYHQIHLTGHYYHAGRCGWMLPIAFVNDTPGFYQLNLHCRDRQVLFLLRLTKFPLDLMLWDDFSTWIHSKRKKWMEVLCSWPFSGWSSLPRMESWYFLWTDTVPLRITSRWNQSSREGSTT